MKNVVIVSLVLLVLVGAGLAVARAGYPRPFACHAHGPLGFIGSQLNLSDAQKTQIKQIWHAESPAIASLIREFAAEQQQMNAATAEGKLDPGKLQLIANNQAATLAKLLVEKEKLLATIYTTVLTPEQRIKADRWRQQWPSRLNGLADRVSPAPVGTGGNSQQ